MVTVMMTARGPAVQQGRRVFPLPYRCERGLVEKRLRSQHACLLDPPVDADEGFDDDDALDLY